MTEEISKTRSGKEFKGDNGQEDLEEFYPKGKDEDDSDELQKPRSDESQTTDIIKLMQFMVLQEQKREQERREEKERREQERREEKERYEQERREEKERYEQEKRRYEQEKREERERYERDRRLEMERQERLEKERERERQEMKKQLDQVQQQRKEELHQLESMMKLREVNMTKLNPTDDIENYLTTFERTAKTFDWPKEKWVVKLVPYLTGKAQAAYAAMSITESNDYDKVKEAILKRYDITEETYRQRFRSTKKFRDESYKEMYVRLKDLFRKWTKPDGKTVDEITETVIMEQLVDTMPPGVQIWVREHRPSTGVAAAELADDYFDTS